MTVERSGLVLELLLGGDLQDTAGGRHTPTPHGTVTFAPGRQGQCVVVASRSDPAPAAVSPMPVRVGLGYTDPARCFRGQIAEFRIWKRALSVFPHAGIDPAAVLEVRALRLEAAPRPWPGHRAAR